MDKFEGIKVGARVRVTKYNQRVDHPCCQGGVVTRVTGSVELGLLGFEYLLDTPTVDSEECGADTMGYCNDADEWEVLDPTAGNPLGEPAAIPPAHAPAPEAMNASGNRKNVGKTKWSLYLRRAWPALEQVVRVTEFGAKKYEPDGWWKKELDEGETCDAIVRHTLAVMSDVYFDKDGNVFYGQNDPESGLPHWAHAAWNCLAIGALRIKKVKALP